MDESEFGTPSAFESRQYTYNNQLKRSRIFTEFMPTDTQGVSSDAVDVWLHREWEQTSSDFSQHRS
jgi:hypothetical protein